MRGTPRDAEALEKQLTADLDAEIRRLEVLTHQEEERAKAASVLGLTPENVTKQRASATRQTLRDFLLTRWAEHAAVVQNTTTRRTTRSHVAYVVYYIGDLRIDEVDEAAVAKLREGLLRDGPRMFTAKRNGEARKPRAATFTPTAVNRITGTLAAALRLAANERVIDRAPKVDRLPADDSNGIVPPSDTELHAILKTAEQFTEVAPLMREAIELAAETGLRAGEEFNLSWRSVDLAMGETGGIRVETQQRVRLVGGQPWKPKHKKFRVVPLSPRAREIVLALRERVPHAPDDPVIPSRGGAPYNRLEAAPDKSGIGYFPQVVETAATGSHVRWHDLRHFFAVRALLRGVPLAVVSNWLGHSDVNLTVKRYGRWAAEAREMWKWIAKTNGPDDAVKAGPALAILDGGRS